jgi:hypothetical protein
MGKSKEISQDLRKEMGDLDKSGSSLGEISKFLKEPRSSVQTTVRNYKHHGTTLPSYRSGRRRVLSLRDKMLEETGTNVSTSTRKRVLYRHNLKGRSARKKPVLQNRHKKAILRFATAHADKYCTFWRNVLWSDEIKI